MKLKKFTTQIDESVLRDLKSFAKMTDRSISCVVSEAIKEFIAQNQTRPALRSVMDEVLDEHAELLKRLAK